MIRSFALVAALFGAAAPALANDFDGKDWAFGIGAGTLGAAVGAGGFALATAALVDDNDGPGALGLVFLAVAVGAPVGATAGAWLYGDLSGHDSRTWAPIVGGLAGGLVGVGGFIASVQLDADELSVPLGLTSLLVLPAVGATTGYYLGLRSDGEVSWRPPQLFIAPDGAGGVNAQALLLDLRF